MVFFSLKSLQARLRDLRNALLSLFTAGQQKTVPKKSSLVQLPDELSQWLCLELQQLPCQANYSKQLKADFSNVFQAWNVVIHFYLAHVVDPDQVQSILHRVAQTSRYTQLQLPIEVIVEEKVWGTLFSLKCYPIDARNEFKYKTDLTIRAKQVFKDHQLAYPKFSPPVLAP